MKHKKDRLGVTIGGPVPGTQFPIKLGKRDYFFATPKDPHYSGAYYVIVPKVTQLREQVAVFTRRLVRGET